MRKFLITISVFIFFLGITGEIIIRIFRLVPDIPERYIDDYGIQRYKPLQSGYYTKAKNKWYVNDYGWLGTHEIKKESTISLIGDSYIENIMNPIECNQGSILQAYFPDYAFFEAGRAGVTFIEAMEISKILEKEVKPKYQLLYLGKSDFLESISEIQKYNDKLQISIKEKKICKAQLKSTGLKKILYSFKLAYYLYLRFPIFVEEQNKKALPDNNSINSVNVSFISELLEYCSEHYNLENLIFVLHPNTNSSIIELIKAHNIKFIVLDSSNDKPWELGSYDGHWSCYGHNQICKQIFPRLNEYLDKKYEHVAQICY